MRIFLSLIIATTLFFGQGNDDVRNLRIFFSNDVHGGIAEQDAEFLNPEFPPRLAGGAAIAHLVQNAREEAELSDDTVLVLDAGDIFQGTAIGTRTDGKAVIEFMNYIGYDACTAGNHDFDAGKENFATLGHMAEFPLISCNIIDRSTGEIYEAVEPYIIKQYGDLRIGITGVTTQGTERMSFPDHIRGLQFTDEVPALKKYVKLMREEEKADIVIAVVHLGLPWDTEGYYKRVKEQYEEGTLPQGNVEAMELAMQVPGIDLMFGGHIHVGYRKPWVDPRNHTLVFQNYANGGNVGMVDIKVDRKTNEIIGWDAPAEDGVLLLLTKDQFRQDAYIDSVLDAKVAEIEKGYDDYLGESVYPLTRSRNGESAMNNLVCDALKDEVGADFAFSNFGGIRADLRAGDLTPRDIFKVLPFGNSIVVAKVDGRFLKRIVEARVWGYRSGLAVSGDSRIVINRSREDGNRVAVFEINGKPIQPDSIYTIATSDYLMEGNSGLDLLREIPESVKASTGILMRQALINYIRKYSPLRIKPDGRYTEDPEAGQTIEWAKPADQVKFKPVERQEDYGY